MIISIYKELLQYKEVGGDMISRIKDLSLFVIFKPLIDKFPEGGEIFNKCLFWILYIYSKESEKDFLGADIQKRKLTIAKELKLPTEHIDLTDAGLRQTIVNYLEYQDYRTFKHLIILREQYEEMISASIAPLFKSDGTTIDYEVKYKCGDFADKLLDRIKYYEDKYKDDNQELSAAIKEVEYIEKRRIGSTLSVDANHYIKE